jgi:hypothetical protein
MTNRRWPDGEAFGRRLAVFPSWGNELRLRRSRFGNRGGLLSRHQLERPSRDGAQGVDRVAHLRDFGMVGAIDALFDDERSFIEISRIGNAALLLAH